MSNTEQPYTVTFVCSGNICRSPMAEIVVAQALTAARLARLVVVDSAGLGDWHVGEPADQRAVATLQKHGYDGSHHRARVFDAAELATTDLVIALDDTHLADLQQMQAAGSKHADVRLLTSFSAAPHDDGVPDPYYSDDAAFELVLTMIEDAVPALLAHVAERVAARTHA